MKVDIEAVSGHALSGFDNQFTTLVCVYIYIYTKANRKFKKLNVNDLHLQCFPCHI